MPARATRHPAKAAAPETAAFGLLVQVRLDPTGAVMAREIGAVLVVVLPKLSSIATTGWVAKGVELAELDGEVVKLRRDGGPAVMVKLSFVVGGFWLLPRGDHTRGAPMPVPADARPRGDRSRSGSVIAGTRPNGLVPARRATPRRA